MYLGRAKIRGMQNDDLKRGRPGLSAEKGRAKAIFVALRPKERELLEKLAAAEGRSLSGQIRQLIRAQLFGEGPA